MVLPFGGRVCRRLLRRPLQFCKGLFFWCYARFQKVYEKRKDCYDYFEVREKGRHIHKGGNYHPTDGNRHIFPVIKPRTCAISVQSLNPLKQIKFSYMKSTKPAQACCKACLEALLRWRSIFRSFTANLVQKHRALFKACACLGVCMPSFCTGNRSEVGLPPLGQEYKMYYTDDKSCFSLRLLSGWNFVFLCVKYYMKMWELEAETLGISQIGHGGQFQRIKKYSWNSSWRANLFGRGLLCSQARILF